MIEYLYEKLSGCNRADMGNNETIWVPSTITKDPTQLLPHLKMIKNEMHVIKRETKVQPCDVLAPHRNQ